jgi:membrane glycosyltransferase
MIDVALSRALAYCRACGVTLTADPSLELIALLRQAIERAEPDPRSWVMGEVRRRFAPMAGAPPAVPPLCRGSIHYDGRGTARHRRARERVSEDAWRSTARIRRVIFGLLLVTQNAAGTYLMLSILPYHGTHWVETALVVLFAILFTWISTGFWLACIGFALRRRGGDPHSLVRRHPAASLMAVPLARTAVVMPVIHEPVDHFMSRLRAVYRSLEQTGEGEAFDFFILSDSRDPNVWLSEQFAWFHLCRELGPEPRLFYRRRPLNLNYKSGNIADFLRRWGRRYEYMVVLDADSLIEGETLVYMVRIMQVEPAIGILQTTPRVIHGRSMFARAEQFANRLYGPLFSTGLASLQLGEAAFWGHNAVIRVHPFMRHCGLRRLRGFGLFRGPILSHDFVEAAQMGRAGYEVWLEPALSRSYEESPPTLLDELARDRRWSRGNLQHLWPMLFEPGLRPAHRVVFLSGVMAYAASPLWLAFLALSTVEATRFVLWPIDYFPKPWSLFPVWPEWHPEWALGLAAATFALLLVPKLLGLIDALIGRRCESLVPPPSRLLVSTFIEALISMLLAPIRMLFHSVFALEAVLGKRLWWGGQNRSEETGWRDALRQHAAGSFLALAWSAYAGWLSSTFIFWTLPISLPLILAAPVSVLLSRPSVARRLQRRGLFVFEEDGKQGTGPIFDSDFRCGSMSAAVGRRGKGGDPLSPLIAAIVDPRTNAVHRALARDLRCGARGRRIARLCARAVEKGPDSLRESEWNRIASDRESLRLLHEAAWCAPPDSAWATIVDHLAGR